MALYGFSEYGYVVKMPVVPLPFVANAPASAGQHRDVINNLTHLADESGQVWCNFAIETGKVLGTDLVGALITAPIHMWRVPLVIRARPAASTVVTTSAADGGGYSLRVRLGGTSVNNNGNVFFCVIVGPSTDPPIAGSSYYLASAIQAGLAAPANATSVTTAGGAAVAWLTLATDIITVTASQLAASITEVQGLDFNGNPIGVTVHALSVDVFGYTTGASNAPQLAGLYVAEYVS